MEYSSTFKNEAVEEALMPWEYFHDVLQKINSKILCDIMWYNFSWKIWTWEKLEKHLPNY